MEIKQEKRLMEAFAQYEAGVSLATLQTLFSDVAVELNQMVEAERMLKEGKVAMRPTPELGRKVIAALAQQQRRNESSVFMSKLWRFAAPVGVAALSFMFILSGQQTIQPEVVVEEQGDLARQGATEMSLFAVQEAEPMMAKNAAVSLMLVPPEQGEGGAVEAPAADSFTMMADEGVDEDAQESQADSLYMWQMICLGLLSVLSILVLIKHWLARASARTP
jgi:hypothetical protein